MPRALSIFILLLFAGSVQGQSTAGLTFVRDTSYTVLNEYNKHRNNYPQLKIAEPYAVPDIIEETGILYHTTPQRVLKTDVYFPAEKTTAKRTAVIFIHGGGWRSGDKAMHRPLLQRLAALGYVCFAPEYRLSTEAFYPAPVYDLKNAVRWVRKNAGKYHLNPNRIVVAGHSAGGELAAFLGATNGKKAFEKENAYPPFSAMANAVIDIDGILAFIHPESGEGDDSKKTSAATYWFGYAKTENTELWKEAAPLTHAGKNCVPYQFLNSSVARMHAGREDFIAVLNKYHIYNEVHTLENAPHSFPLFQPWFDTTVAYMDDFLRKIFPAPQKNSRIITVSQNGSGDFRTVQEAILSVPPNNKKTITLFVKRGIYQEKILVDSLRTHIQLVGEDRFNTIITYNDHTGKLAPNGDTINTRSSWTFKIMAADFMARNITFQNDAGFNAGQAVAIESNGDRAAFFQCRFIGFQDVLFTNSENSRQYFEHCYIEGTTDFIFGSATAWFEKCTIYSKKNSHVTAASTPAENPFGYVFNQCRLEGDTSLHNVSLGRPWRPNASVTYMHCYLGAHIKPEGWSVWNNNENHLHSRYAEYRNYGPGAALEKRVNWARQLTEEAAKKHTLQQVLSGWNPIDMR